MQIKNCFDLIGKTIFRNYLCISLGSRGPHKSLWWPKFGPWTMSLTIIIISARHCLQILYFFSQKHNKNTHLPPLKMINKTKCSVTPQYFSHYLWLRSQNFLRFQSYKELESERWMGKSQANLQLSTQHGWTIYRTL